MKTLILSLGLALGVTFAAGAQSYPSYATFSQAGTTSAAYLIPHLPQNQIRVVSVIATSDKAAATLKLYTGTAAHYVYTANASTAATSVIVESTNGMAAGNLLFLQGATSNAVVTISSFANPTNITTTGAVGIAQTVGMEVQVITNNITLQLGANTNKTFVSDGLFVGRPGRAVYAILDGTSACSIDSLTVHYDSTSGQ
ncbi:MAG: hypothetical protein JWR69_84 [Pedosphaera sp.]|nr:hypothetical protein [Pedosphaera sp.]